MPSAEQQSRAEGMSRGASRDVAVARTWHVTVRPMHCRGAQVEVEGGSMSRAVWRE